jgi:hypothetical protein
MYNSHLFAWCVAAFLLSAAIPFAGFALIPIYIVVDRRRRREHARINKLATKYAFQAHKNWSTKS